MGQRKIIPKEVIQAEYLDKPVSMLEACRVIGCSMPTLVRLLEEYGLPRKLKSWNPKRTNKYPQLQDRAWLATQLETKSAQQIAREIGTTSGNVSDFVKRYGLRTEGDLSTAIKHGIQKAFPDGKIEDYEHHRPFHYSKVYMPDHPYASKNGYVLKHRLIVESKIGRYLKPGETVHHRDHNPKNDEPDNLIVFETLAEHTAFHHHERRQKNEVTKTSTKQKKPEKPGKENEPFGVSWFPVDGCAICDEFMQQIKGLTEQEQKLRQELAQILADQKKIDHKVNRLILDNQLRMFEDASSDSNANALLSLSNHGEPKPTHEDDLP